MAVVSPQTKRHMTEQDFMCLPDDGRKYDLVDGEPKEVPAGFEHDVIGINLAMRIGPYARGRGVLAGSQAGFRMVNGNIRCPDLSFTARERLPGGRPNRGFGDVAPDLCIEIISPSEERAEMQDKVEEYFGAGAQQVWQLFPDEMRVRIFLSPGDFTDYFEEEEISAEDLLPGFICRVSEFFDTGLD